ncbi:MAG: patatin-like phospholipase family protein [Actinomycetia bacterium]|nr:patatin-like phospholipase family protein [Actinomycetes bacterium]
MTAHSWFDFLRRGPFAPPVQGLVLSGGGARVSFQLGALAYLYGHEIIAPTRIVGTSGGSIVATTLAQSLDPAGQAAALAELDRTWMAMTGPEDMFVEQAWFTQVRAEAGGFRDLLAAQDPKAAAPGARAAARARERQDAYTLIQQALEDDPSRGTSWSVTQAWQLLSVLPKIGRAGATLAASLRGASLAQSMFRPGPIVMRLLYESTFREERVRTSGVELRIAMVGLNSGQLRFMRQDGRLVDRDNRPLPGEAGEVAYDLPLGVWASCAIPGVFKPVALGDEVYVDGGVRENVPVEMAVTHLGVTQPYVVVASPPGVAPGDYADRDVISSVLRATSLTSDEAMVDEIAWARAAGAVVIDPEVDVHDAMTVEPGLARLNHDYGYLRAAEEVLGADETARTLTRDLVTARLALHRLPPDAGSEAARLRSRVGTLVARCDPALLPPGADDWACADLASVC